jgi:hypothetical protein
LTARFLDAAIARHLFGFEVEPRRNARTGELDYVCRRPGQEWSRVPFYTCASDVMTLAVEFKLSDLGWKLTPASDARRQATGSVRVVLERNGEQVEGAASTFEAALCVAALRAVGPGDAVLGNRWKRGERASSGRRNGIARGTAASFPSTTDSRRYRRVCA